MHVAVLGAGSWGTALAVLLARNGHEVLLLGRDEHERFVMKETRENHRYLPGFELPFNIQVEDIRHQAQAELAVIAVPAAAVVPVLAETQIQAPLKVIASKGLEADTGRLLCDVVEEARHCTTGVLSGPNLAVEIVRGIPTVAVAASAQPSAAKAIQEAFNSPNFRVSTTDDVIGVELAGALKNVLAIAAGMSDGLGFGDNTKGALLSRGLIELSRLGLAMGARMETFLGPAGVGDLFATAASTLSRNYRCGRALGEGMTLQQALDSLGQVAEGVPTSHATLLLAKREGVDMPIFGAVDAVIRGRVAPREAVSMLMERGSSMRSFID